MSDKRVILPLLLIFGLGAGAVFLSDDAAQPSSEGVPIQENLPDSNGNENGEVTSQLDPSEVQRSDLAEQEVVIKDGWFTIELVSSDGTLIHNGQVAWLPAEPDGAKPQPISSERNGEFRVFTNNHPGWFLAEAKSFWPRKVPLKLDSKTNLVIHLDSMDSFSSFVCREEPGFQLAAHVFFQAGSGSPVGSDKNLRGFSSDSNGYLRLPFESDEVLRLQVDEKSEDRFAPFVYSLSATDKVIPVFKKCRARVFVTQDDGSTIPQSGIGIAPIYYGAKQAGGIFASLEGYESLTDPEGKKDLELILGIPQTIWAMNQDRGYSSIVVTPMDEYQEYSIVVGEASPLILDIVLPANVPRTFLSVIVTNREGTTNELVPGGNGLFQIDFPIDVKRVNISAKGCQPIQGFLPDLRRGLDGTKSKGGGFIRWKLERGYTVKGFAKWADGAPSTNEVFMVRTEGPASVTPHEQYGASAWNWALMPPLLSQRLDPQGKFEFQDIPPGTYFLDQMDKEGGRSSDTTFATFYGPASFIEVPTSKVIEITFLRLRKVELHVNDDQSGEAIPAFSLDRPGASEGYYGRTGHGQEGLFVGTLPVDELAAIEISADGYLPRFLKELDLDEHQDRLVGKMLLKKINPGLLQVIVDGPELSVGEKISIRVSDLGPQDERHIEDVTLWTEFFDCTPGNRYQLLVPVEGFTTLEIVLYKESQRNVYRVSPDEISYAPGQTITISVEPNIISETAGPEE